VPTLHKLLDGGIEQLPVEADFKFPEHAGLQECIAQNTVFTAIVLHHKATGSAVCSRICVSTMEVEQKTLQGLLSVCITAPHAGQPCGKGADRDEVSSAVLPSTRSA
jgi:hypothetical protein